MRSILKCLSTTCLRTVRGGALHIIKEEIE